MGDGIDGNAGGRLREAMEQANEVSRLAAEFEPGILTGAGAGSHGAAIARRAEVVRETLLEALRRAALESGPDSARAVAEEADAIYRESEEVVSTVRELDRLRLNLDRCLRNQNSGGPEAEREMDRVNFSRNLRRKRREGELELKGVASDSPVFESLVRLEALAGDVTFVADERRAAREQGRAADPDVLDGAPNSRSFATAVERCLGASISESASLKKRDNELCHDLGRKHAALAMEVGGDEAVRALQKLANVSAVGPYLGVPVSPREWVMFDVELCECGRVLGDRPSEAAAPGM